MRRVRLSVLLVLLSPGCESSPSPSEPEPVPEIVATGSRTRIAVADVEQVCAGTIAALDDELTRVEHTLGLEPLDTLVDLVLLDAEQLAAHCGPGVYGCTLTDEPGRVFVRDQTYEWRTAHELVHARLAPTHADGSPPLFDEGIAAAHAPPTCPVLPGESLPDLDELLAAVDAASLPRHGEYLGGELLRWLLDTHGPQRVIAFLAAIRGTRDADEIRAIYQARFGSSLDDDLFAHLRPLDAALSPAQAGCHADEPPPGPDFTGYMLMAALDCDSPRVHTDFARPDRLYVEWTVSFDEATTIRFRGSLPAGSELRIEPCACRLADGTSWPPRPSHVIEDEYALFNWLTMAPGSYRIRWSGPPAATLEVQLVIPCDLATQDCPGGLACTPWGECIEPPTDPQLLDEPCNIDNEELMGSCDVGLVCLGDVWGDGVDEGVCMMYCGDGDRGIECPDGLGCSHYGVCTVGCDPLAQDCANGWACEPEFETGEGACIPPGRQGLLAPCSVILPDCAPGLVCEEHRDIEGCSSDSWISFSGCCTPICAADNPDSMCPAELPQCDVDDGDVLGVCEP